MARLEEVSCRQRRLLLDLAEHAHLPAKNGFRRPGSTRFGKTRWPIVSFAKIGPLYRLALVTLGDVAPGRKGVVLTPEGERLRREIEARLPPKPVAAAPKFPAAGLGQSPDAAPPPHYWWQDA